MDKPINKLINRPIDKLIDILTLEAHFKPIYDYLDEQLNECKVPTNDYNDYKDGVYDATFYMTRKVTQMLDNILGKI